MLCYLFFSSCSNTITTAVDDSKEEAIDEPDVWEVISIPKWVQRTGNATKGKAYLFSGDYMSSGIPYAVYLGIYGQDNENVLNRTGDNAVINSGYTAVTAPNGVRVVAPNCLNCHSAKINNTYVIGLGNHSSDFTFNRADLEPLLTSGIAQVYGADSPEFEAYQQFRKSILAIGPKTITQSIGVNSANKIAEVLTSHRDKNTFEWRDTPFVAITNDVIPVDVPAWWLLKSKNALFYTALLRNDFCKSFIGASLLTLKDLDKAKEIDAKMPDVLAYLKSLEAPDYPFPINSSLAEQGKPIFDRKCAGCHGNYGTPDAYYPNSLVALSTIKTDAELSNHYTTTTIASAYFAAWLNTGYLGADSNGIVLKAEGGYVAPPLDGVWATAPYFHNASVPTLMDVLNSKNRPVLWSRTFDATDYNQTKVGWNYTVETIKVQTKTYDTTLKGYGNGGHTFGDELSETERLAVIEYLKTL